MESQDRNHIASFLRRVADQIESNERFDFNCSIRAKKPSTVSIDNGGNIVNDSPEFNDFYIELSVRDFKSEDTKA